MSIHVCKCEHNGRTEYHLRYPGMTHGEAQALADSINGGELVGAGHPLRKDAERYRLIAENIDYTDNGDGTGFYWHNQRGEFSFEYRHDPDGDFRPTFESVIDAAVLARKAVG